MLWAEGALSKPLVEKVLAKYGDLRIQPVHQVASYVDVTKHLRTYLTINFEKTAFLFSAREPDGKMPTAPDLERAEHSPGVSQIEMRHSCHAFARHCRNASLVNGWLL